MLKIEEIPQKINSANLYAVNDLRYEIKNNYELKENNVLVKIKNCGICSSDIERVLVSGTYHFPTICGHEMSGQVVAVNDEDKEYLGKRVCIFPMLPCFECDACKKQEYAQCSNYSYFGSRCDGGYQEYLLVPTWNLIVFDENLDYDVAALCEPSAVSLHAIHIGDIKPGELVAVNGTGTIAFLIATFAKNMGANVTMFAHNEKNKDTALELGINYKVFDKDDKTSLGTADKVFEVVGTNESIGNSMMLANNFATIVLVGNPKDDLHLEKKVYWSILRKQLTVKGTWNSSYNDKINDWKDALIQMQSAQEDFRKLITHTFSLKECNEAFELLNDKSIRKIKVMFNNEK